MSYTTAQRRVVSFFLVKQSFTMNSFAYMTSFVYYAKNYKRIISVSAKSTTTKTINKARMLSSVNTQINKG